MSIPEIDSTKPALSEPIPIPEKKKMTNSDIARNICNHFSNLKNLPSNINFKVIKGIPVNLNIKSDNDFEKNLLKELDKVV